MPKPDHLQGHPCCGARTRAGGACRQPAMANGRCRLHGGPSTGAITPAGRDRARFAHWRHGRRSQAAVAAHRAWVAFNRAATHDLNRIQGDGAPDDGRLVADTLRLWQRGLLLTYRADLLRWQAACHRGQPMAEPAYPFPTVAPGERAAWELWVLGTTVVSNGSGAERPPGHRPGPRRPDDDLPCVATAMT